MDDHQGIAPRPDQAVEEPDPVAGIDVAFGGSSLGGERSRERKARKSSRRARAEKLAAGRYRIRDLTQDLMIQGQGGREEVGRLGNEGTVGCRTVRGWATERTGCLSAQDAAQGGFLPGPVRGAP